MTGIVRVSRRRLLLGLAGGAGTLSLGGCAMIGESPAALSIIDEVEGLTRRVQRALLGSRDALAPEYTLADISPWFKPNGSTAPADPTYQVHAKTGFADWTLKVDGLVEMPFEISLADLKAMPSRTQITRHDCVEGWSCIGQWKGVPLKLLLDKARLKSEAKLIAFFCADDLEQTLDGTGRYYETHDLVDAYHPQTILAYDLNGHPLGTDHGAPLRLRVERQLGYKMAKYVMRISAISSYANLGRGQGGFWEDRGYEWYAGI